MSLRLDQDDRLRDASDKAPTRPMDSPAPTTAEVTVWTFAGLVALIVVVALALSTCSGSTGRSDGTAVSACIDRGTSYFAEIGSYPTLSDGRNAATVAAERCNRTTTAF